MVNFHSVKFFGLFGVILARCSLQNSKKVFHAIFLKKKYVFFRFFDAKSSIFKSSKWCEWMKKIAKIEKSIFFDFLALDQPLWPHKTFWGDRNTRNMCFEHFFFCFGGILMQKSWFLTFFCCFFDDFPHPKNYLMGQAAVHGCERIEKNRNRQKSV